MTHSLKSLFSQIELSSRNPLLDVTKGLAIILVVLGHTLQASLSNFDNAWSFRVIYSFHMPLFVLLSGGAASFWISPLLEANNAFIFLKSSARRIFRSAIQLLLPFVAWTTLAFLLHPTNERFFQYLKKIFLQPDYSLWFLPCIFWCIVYISILSAALFIMRCALNAIGLQGVARFFRLPFVEFIFMLAVWVVLRTKLPSEYGLVFVNWQSGGLFFYFLIGLFCFNAIEKLKSPWLRGLPYITFALLALFWHRTEQNNLTISAPDYLKHTWVASYYVYLVAIAGSLVVLDIAKNLLAINEKK